MRCFIALSLPEFARLAQASSGPGIAPKAAASMVGATTELAGAWTFSRCALYKSELLSSGAVYTELRGADLPKASRLA
jgi:hypothetical protein